MPFFLSGRARSLEARATGVSAMATSTTKFS